MRKIKGIKCLRRKGNRNVGGRIVDDNQCTGKRKLFGKVVAAGILLGINFEAGFVL